MVEEKPFDPRQRVIGAVILVVLAVVILPILLRRPPSRMKGQDVLTIRRTDHTLTTHWVQGQPKSRGKGPVSMSTAAPVLSVKSAAGGAMAAAAKPPAPAVSGAATTKGLLSKPLVAPRPQKGGWYVQVGAYVNASDALSFRRHLHAQGFPAHVKLAQLASGHGVVVIVGPYRRAEALTARAAVARRDKIRGFLIRMAAGAR